MRDLNKEHFYDIATFADNYNHMHINALYNELGVLKTMLQLSIYLGHKDAAYYKLSDDLSIIHSHALKACISIGNLKITSARMKQQNGQTWRNSVYSMLYLSYLDTPYTQYGSTDDFDLVENRFKNMAVKYYQEMHIIKWWWESLLQLSNDDVDFVSLTKWLTYTEDNKEILKFLNLVG